jgi:DNA-binding LacI/PurR family transcriptional regulator
MAVTLKEISEKTGVSISTVSRIINNDQNKKSSKKTAEKVWKIVKELGYVPNTNARNLVKRYEKPENAKTNIIGCILASPKENFKDPFFTQIMSGIQNEVQPRGYLMGYSFSYCEDSGTLLNKILSHKVDGTVVLGRLSDDFLYFLKKNINNLVYAGLNSLDADFDEVICDSYKASCCAVEYLINLGHTKIGYIGSIPGKESLNVINEHRFKAFCDTINKYNLELCKDNIQNIEFSMIEGYKAMNTILQNGNIPTAIFCTTDDAAIGAMKAIHKFGLKVPNDISIIGLADLEMSEYIRPTLTTVRVPKVEIGMIAAKVLIDKIESGHTIPIKIELPFKLIERESCRAISKCEKTPLKKD